MSLHRVLALPRYVLAPAPHLHPPRDGLEQRLPQRLLPVRLSRTRATCIHVCMHSPQPLKRS